MRRFKRAILMTCAIAVLAVGAAACDDDNDDAESNDNASQESIDALALRVERNEQMFAIIALSKLGIHDMDEGLNSGGAVEPSYSPNTTEAIRLLALTDWGRFQDDAEDLKADAEALLTALRDENLQAAGPAATALHEGQHDLTGAVWNEIAKDLDPEFGGPEEHEEGDGTPDEGETPPAGEESPRASETPEEDH